jgi:hypothetical protein
MYGIPVIDVPAISFRYARSALPQAPVRRDGKRWRSGVAVRAGRR